MNDSTTGLQFEAVTKSYGNNEVLKGITAYLEPNKIYGLLGANGAGKTTLMSVICNHTFRSGGTILVDGEDPRERAATLERMCFIREDQSYSESLTVKQVLNAVPAFYDTWSAETASRLVERFRLPIKLTPVKLSRGQRSALAIIIALSSRAPYTFLDEPYLGLDPTARGLFYDTLLEEFTEHPRTVIMSTHLIDEAADLMEEVLVIRDGEIALRADVEEARSGAFIARGLETDVRELVGDRPILSERRLGRILSATVGERASVDDLERADELRVSIEPASLQELVAAIGIHDLAGPEESAPATELTRQRR